MENHIVQITIVTILLLSYCRNGIYYTRKTRYL